MVIICVVLHNMLMTHQGRIVRVLTTGDDIAAIANELAVYVLVENHRNLSVETRHLQDQMFTSFMLVHWLGKRTGSEMACHRRNWHLIVLLRTTLLLQYNFYLS